MLPASILTEAMAQAGAVLILSKPENRAAPHLLHGHRPRALPPAGRRRATPCCLEGTVVRLRSKMGSLRGVARVDGQVVCEGRMTFALGERRRAGCAAAGGPAVAPAPRQRRPLSLARALSKFGVCSRKEAERWIEAGRVEVDGRT